MGIPRFYRSMSERYPLLNQPISDVSLLPEFDCFYLDMNGIIHNCTHGDGGDDERNSLTLAAQLQAIFAYIDRLVTHIIKPKQLVYIAIDGVAPRAKLNQQRSRRFRAGLDRMNQLKEKHRQIKLEDEKNGTTSAASADVGATHFDSNSITPGTPFLHAMSSQLVYFVRQKMKSDPLWSRLEVFFSGSEVPGEGEHKIVDFIRRRKMLPGYAPNVRHCMYGSDADLMLLGLMTHEPHFTLVRETVVWGRQQAVKAKKIEEEQWQLVHLSLFREYLMMEMRVVPPFDGERMLDDFILLTFLLGNDFIPHSPTLEIREDAIPLLLRVYREHLEKHGGLYLTENGKLINLPLLQDLFHTIGGMEEQILLDRAKEEAKFNKKRHFRSAEPDWNVEEDDVMDARRIAQLNVDEDDDNDRLPDLLDDDEDEEEAEKEILEVLEGKTAVELAAEMEAQDHEIFVALTGSESFQDTKWVYYKRKFGIERGNGNANNASLDQVKKHYMEAVMWCLAYYFQGPPSWSWYYPYHYAPMISDLTNIEAVAKEIEFGNDPQDGPLLPFEQLMANLPAASAHLVPEPYRFLMKSPLSPIKHFYPEEFEVDMEGKRNEWEGVNILPFIDAHLLREAIAQYCPESQLTPAERERNRLQMRPLRIVRDPSAKETVRSCLPGTPGFPDIVACGTRVEEYDLPEITANGGCFLSRLMDGVQLPLAGFPSLYTLAFESVSIRSVELNCFGMKTKKGTLVLQLPGVKEIPDAQELLGRTVLTNWPHLHEAKVVGVSTLDGIYRMAEHGDEPVYTQHNGPDKMTWASWAESEVRSLLSGRGTPGSGGIDLGRGGIVCVLHVLPLQGMVSNPETGAIQKKFGDKEAVVPLQLAVMDRTLYDARFAETAAVDIETRFPMGSEVLITKGKWFGCTGSVQGYVKDKNRVCVHVNTMDSEPPFGYAIAESLKDKYLPGFVAARQLGISTSTLGALAGAVKIVPFGADIGLNLRFRKHLLLPGYCRLVSKQNGSTPLSDDDNVWRSGDIVKILGSDVELSSDQANKSNGDANGTVWEFSERAMDVFFEYKKRFPQIFANLDRLGFATAYEAKQLFGMKEKAALAEEVKEVVDWIASLKLVKNEQTRYVPPSSQFMALGAMLAIEAAGALRASERQKHAAATKKKPVVAALFPSELFRPNLMVNQDLSGLDISMLASTNVGAPILGDRVMNICARGVPLGHRGTVIATHVSSRCVEVLFDESFTGGEPLFGAKSLNRGKILPWNSLLCVSTPPENLRTKRHPRQQVSKNSSFHQRNTATRPQLLTLSRNTKNNNSAPTKPCAGQPTSFGRAAPVAAPQPPPPAKLNSLLKKWGHKGHQQADSSSNEIKASQLKHNDRQRAKSPAKGNAASANSGELSPSVAALFSSAAASSQDTTVAPSVAKFFADAGAPPLPTSNPGPAVNDLFPHNYSATRAPAAPPAPFPAGTPVFIPHARPSQAPAPPQAPASTERNGPPSREKTNKPYGKRDYVSKQQPKAWVKKDESTPPSSGSGSTRLLLPTQVLRQQKAKSSASS